MTQDTLTFLIVILGSSTVFLSVVVAVKFYMQHKSLSGNSKRLSNAIYWNLLGEACIGAGTLAFALLAWSGRLEHLSIYVQSTMRLTMFLATALSTLHLLLTIERMNNE